MVVYLIRSNEKFNFTDLTYGSPNDPYHMYIFSEGNTSLAVSPFLWNLYFSNKILMNLTFNGKYFNVSIIAINISYISPSIHVLGYPGFMYGYETWFSFSEMGKTKEYGLYLPEKLSNLSNFYSFLYYTVWNVTGRIDDFSYDMWLTPQPNVPQLSKGDIEVMIWNYWGQNLSNVPYFAYIGNAHFPTYINGTIKNVNYSIYILNYTGSMNGWTGVYYLMQDHGI
ncbi:MAG: hypothetical protein JZD40_05460 [Sulfolobus sp.]|nr:hypothetical protein [Sulfolobus sp.]